MANTANLRALTAIAINSVVDQGQSLTQLLPKLQQTLNERDRPLLQELCFGCLRTLPLLDWCIRQLMQRVMTGKQRSLHYLLMVGVYQLLYTRIPAHAALAETVNGATALKRPQLKGLINGVLRQFQRQQQQLLELSASDDCQFLHPDWLLRQIQHSYPEQWQNITTVNNQKPPMWLRINQLQQDRHQYLSLLAEKGITAFPHPDYPDGLRLVTPCNVNLLPGFAQGWVSVQDASAQLCAPLLAPQNGEYILDLCAAPGGKTTHILEIAPKARVLAVDIDELRLKRISENLTRANLQATIRLGDGRNPDCWWEGQLFDRILLDAPCSATGVIRRHPDIKWLRRENDIPALVELQAEMLQAIWPCLKPGGVLLYATCSILPQENEQQIARFLQQYEDAELEITGNGNQHGWQQLPATELGDGFFYAKLHKKPLP